MPEVTYTFDEITLQIVQHLEGAPPLAFKERFAPETGRLFAAAPELLAFAIQYLWSEHGECASHHEAAPYTPSELRDLARAAIARAEGRA